MGKDSRERIDKSDWSAVARVYIDRMEILKFAPATFIFT